MKIKQKKKVAFVLVVITLETLEELRLLVECMGKGTGLYGMYNDLKKILHNQ